MKKPIFTLITTSILLLGFLSGCILRKPPPESTPSSAPTQVSYGIPFTSFSGDKPDNIAIQKPEGPALVHMVYAGPDSFVVRAYDKDGNETSNSIGR